MSSQCIASSNSILARLHPNSNYVPIKSPPGLKNVSQRVAPSNSARARLRPNPKNIPKNRVNNAQLIRVTGVTRCPDTGGGRGKVLPGNPWSVTRSVQEAVFRDVKAYFASIKFGGFFAAAAAVHTFVVVATAVCRSIRRGGGRGEAVPAEKGFHEAVQKYSEPGQ